MYTDCLIPANAAGLSFFITLTFFPLLICLYTLLGSNYDKLRRSVDFLGTFLAEDTINIMRDFLDYVAMNNKPAMMFAGLIVLLTFSSASIRLFQNFIGSMQGGKRFDGIAFFMYSILFSLVMLAAVYFAMIVMLTGDRFIELIERDFPFIYLPFGWQTIRFPILGIVFFIFIYGLYSTSKRDTDTYPTVFGSLLSTVNIVLISMLFSSFISKSARYPLVYGSLASIVLFMLWMYYCCTVICCGAAFNIVIRDIRMERLKAEYNIE